MIVFIFALCSLIILIPILFILPLRFTKKGKLLIVLITIVISLVSLFTNMVVDWWQSMLLLALLVIVSAYVLYTRFHAVIYEAESSPKQMDQVEKPQAFSYLDKDRVHANEKVLTNEQNDIHPLHTDQKNEMINDFDENVGDHREEHLDLTQIQEYEIITNEDKQTVGEEGIGKEEHRLLEEENAGKKLGESSVIENEIIEELQLETDDYITEEIEHRITDELLGDDRVTLDSDELLPLSMTNLEKQATTDTFTINEQSYLAEIEKMLHEEENENNEEQTANTEKGASTLTEWIDDVDDIDDVEKDVVETLQGDEFDYIIEDLLEQTENNETKSDDFFTSKQAAIHEKIDTTTTDDSEVVVEHLLEDSDLMNERADEQYVDEEKQLEVTALSHEDKKVVNVQADNFFDTDDHLLEIEGNINNLAQLEEVEKQQTFANEGTNLLDKETIDKTDKTYTNIGENEFQRAMFQSILDQLIVEKGTINNQLYEQKIIDCLHEQMPLEQYYHFAWLLMDHYLKQQETGKLHALLNELQQKYADYPIIQAEIEYLRTTIVSS